MKKIDKIWVGAFEIPEGHRLYGGAPAEVALIGRDGDFIRCTTEHEVGSLVSLITMCRQIARDEGLKWRLIEFSVPREVSEEEMQEWLTLCAHRVISIQ